MNGDNTITITEKDKLRIENLFQELDSGEIENLQVELDRANIIGDNEVVPELVTMNSKVEYYDSFTQRKRIITIVYPKDANTSEGKISVLATIGSALIGLREGQKINWKFPSGGARQLKVERVLFQPEKEKLWHL